MSATTAGVRTNLVGWVSALVGAHATTLAAIAVSEGLTRTDAVDAVQEALVTLLSMRQARELALDEEGASQLMAVLVRNAARNMRRRHHRARPHEPLDDEGALVSDAPSVEALLASAEEHAALAGCVAQLGEVQRRVVTLRVLDELSARATAERLSLTSGHVAVLLHRAKLALLDCLASSGMGA